MIISIGELAYQKLHASIAEIMVNCPKDNAEITLETKLALGKLIWDAKQRSYFDSVDLIGMLVQGDEHTTKLLRESYILASNLYNAHGALQ